MEAEGRRGPLEITDMSPLRLGSWSRPFILPQRVIEVTRLYAHVGRLALDTVVRKHLQELLPGRL